MGRGRGLWRLPAGRGRESPLSSAAGRVCQPLWAESLIWGPGPEFCQRPEGSPGMGTCFQQAQIQRKICF